VRENQSLKFNLLLHFDFCRQKERFYDHREDRVHVTIYEIILSCVSFIHIRCTPEVARNVDEENRDYIHSRLEESHRLNTSEIYLRTIYSLPL